MDGVEGEEGEVGEAQMDAQLLLFFWLATLGREVMGEDNAACEIEFGCQQGVFFAPLASAVAELEGREGGEGESGRMGVRMRMVRGVEGEGVEGKEGEEGRGVRGEGGGVAMRIAAVVA